MNRILTCSAALLLTGASLALADIPNLINYQGRLTTEAGAPVTGSKNFALSIYDAATGGNLLYTEPVGAVTLDANGVYSFQFGSAGTSNTLATEAIAPTDGTATSYQKVLAQSPVVAGSVSVTDGTYTWSQAAGSSNEDDFGVAYSTSLRRVTATYYNGAPAAGRAITATYSYGTSGITGAISSGAEHWMAISVDGIVQGTRQRVLAVPFALNAQRSSVAIGLETKVGTTPLIVFSASSMNNWVNSAGPAGTVTRKLPVSVSPNDRGNGTSDSFYRTVPTEVTTIRTLSTDTMIISGGASVQLVAYSSSGARTVVASQNRSSSGKILVSGPFVLDHSSYEYAIECGISCESGGMTTLNPLVMEYEK